MAYHRRNRSKTYQVKDKFFLKAKDEGYRARSAYKLKEILEKNPIIKSGYHVLDLGAAPGSFLQVASRIVGTEGIVIGVDLKPIKPLANVKTFVADIFDHNCLEKILGEEKFDAVISDLASNTTGIKFIDKDNSVELNLAALKTAKRHLKKGGGAIFKIFQSHYLNNFLFAAKRLFDEVALFKPKAVRETSSEIYVVCTGFKW